MVLSGKTQTSQYQQVFPVCMTYLRYLDTPALCIYLFKQNRVIVPDEILESYPDKNIYRKDLKFSDRSSGLTVQTEISLFFRNRSDWGLHS